MSGQQNKSFPACGRGLCGKWFVSAPLTIRLKRTSAKRQSFYDMFAKVHACGFQLTPTNEDMGAKTRGMFSMLSTCDSLLRRSAVKTICCMHFGVQVV